MIERSERSKACSINKRGANQRHICFEVFWNRSKSCAGRGDNDKSASRDWGRAPRVQHSSQWCNSKERIMCTGPTKGGWDWKAHFPWQTAEREANRLGSFPRLAFACTKADIYDFCNTNHLKTPRELKKIVPRSFFWVCLMQKSVNSFWVMNE